MSLKLCQIAIRSLSKHEQLRNRYAQTHMKECVRWKHHQSLRPCSTAILPEAPVQGTEREYPQKIKDIVNQISQLSLLEVADLNEYLKKTLRITDAPIMAAGIAAAAPAAAAAEEEDVAQAKFEKVDFTVILQKFDESKKVALIKAIKGMVSGMNLVQAKKFVESAPATVKTDIPKEEAEKIKKDLEAVGATVELE